ncbi:MAG: thioredoxin family protein [Candidatus Marinimicrobia bacterium]|nr:thioredoxin family protein [Candidatus Neomarinimicrobiota bacterium]
MVNVLNFKHLEKVTKNNDLIYPVVFYSRNSEKSKRVLDIFKELESENKSIEVLTVDVSEVKDVHRHFNIDSIPAVAIIEKGRVQNIIYGLQDKEFFIQAFEEKKIKPTKKAEKKSKRIVVYTTDGCPWCVRAKEYLKSLALPFKEVNLSKNPGEIDKLVKRTGQMGTPQIDINGKFVIGFNKPEIDRLLGVKK